MNDLAHVAGWELYHADPAQPLTTAAEELDHISVDYLSAVDLTDLCPRRGKNRGKPKMETHPCTYSWSNYLLHTYRLGVFNSRFMAVHSADITALRVCDIPSWVALIVDEGTAAP